MTSVIITLNSFPKCGIHALAKIVRLLGVVPIISHTEYPKGAEKSIFIKRNPKDIIISSLRWTKNDITRDSILERMNSFYHKEWSIYRKQNIIEALYGFEGWLHCDTTLVVSYENLVMDIGRISEFLGVLNRQDIARLIPGDTLTWNATRSNHIDFWDETIDRRWCDIGGKEMCSRWGY